MLKIGFRTIGNEVEFFATTVGGMHVIGRGRDGLDKVVGALVFYDLQEYLRRHFEGIEDLWSGALMQGVTLEADVGFLGFEGATLFMTSNPSQRKRFLEVDKAVKWFVDMSKTRRQSGSSPAL